MQLVSFLWKLNFRARPDLSVTTFYIHYKGSVHCTWYVAKELLDYLQIYTNHQVYIYIMYIVI